MQKKKQRLEEKKNQAKGPLVNWPKKIKNKEMDKACKKKKKKRN